MSAIPQATWSGEINIAGLTLHVHVLDDGRRIIDAADVEAFFAWLGGNGTSDEEIREASETVARFIKGEWRP